MQLPADWEMLRFSRDVAKGRCSFLDRYEVRLEISWKTVPGAPDTRRMLSDYKARLSEEGVEGIEVVYHGPWAGLIGQQNGRTVSRFGRYFESEKCLFEIVLPWPQRRELALEQPILDSIEVADAAESARHWRAFGMDVTVPPRFFLSECNQQAGQAEFVFLPMKGFGELRFKRLGFVPHWLQGSVPDWLKTQIPRGVSVTSEESNFTGRHETFWIHGRAKIWNRGLHRHRPLFEARAGLCPNDGRLHFAARLGPPGLHTLPLNCACHAPAESLPNSAKRTATGTPEGEESWVGMLRAKPVQNKAARTEFRQGGLLVTVPRDPRKALKAPLSWIVPVSKERSALLDQLGREVWDRCNGRHTVEQIIAQFAEIHTLTFHEARVSVTGYLKDLIQRGILAVEVGEKR